MCFKHALFLKCEKIDFENCKNNVKQMIFFKAILKLCSFSFCIWFYVFAPGSHCFAIDKLNRSAICTVHFRSIWTAPLRFSTCRSWAGSKVTAAKLDPKKSKFHLPNWMFKCFFSHFFHIFFTFFFHVFFQVHFQNAFFSHFFQAHFQNAFFFFHILCENMQNNCVLKMRLEKHVNKCVLKMWKTCE